MVSEPTLVGPKSMANLTAEQYDTLQEMLKVITEARQTSERLSESWAKGLANLIGPHTNHQSSPITLMTPSQSPQPPDPPDLLLVDPEAAKMVDTRTQSLIDVNKQLAETHTTQLEQLQKHSEESTAWPAEIDERFMDIKNVRANPLPRESSVTLISYPTPTKPPDPPDFNRLRQNPTIKAPDPPDFNQSELVSAIQIPNKLSLRYSCEEIHERMTNGLCIFCEELDTPGHYNLKHKGSKLCLVESVSDKSPDDEKPDEVTVEEISNKSLNMIREKESHLENESMSEVSLSQSQVLFSPLEPSHRCHKIHNHYESLEVVDERMCNELVCDEDDDSIITKSAKFHETYEEPQSELVCLKQSHDPVENHLDNIESALTRSSLRHTPTYQYRAPFSPYQNCNDTGHYKREFGNYSEPGIEFDRASEEVEDDELQDKQPEDEVFGVDVETVVMNEDEQPHSCDDEKNAVTSSVLCDRQAVLETEKKIEVSDSTKTNCEANFSDLFPDCKDSFRESEEQHLSCQLVLEAKVGGHETDVLAINERADNDDGPNMQVCFVHDVECISRFFRKIFNMCFQEKRDASDQTTVEVDMNSTSLFYSITKDVDAQGRELEASGFTRKEQNDLDKFVKGGLEKAIDEHKDIKTILVLLAMGFNEDKWKLFYLVKDYGDGGGITLLKLPLNSSDAFEKIRKGEVKVAYRTQNHACGVDTRCMKPNCYVFLCLCILLLRRVKRQYTLELLDEFECLGCTYMTTPVETNVELLSQDDGVRHNASFYRKVFGKLIYITVSLMIVTGLKQIIWSGNSKTVAATEVNQNSETSQEYLLLFLEIVKATFEIMLTVEHFENPLASILTYEVFHLQRPPEISTKCSLPNILNFILEDKDVLKREVL